MERLTGSRAKYLLSVYIEWMLRRRSPWLRVMWMGIALWGLAFGTGVWFLVSLPVDGQPFVLSVDSAGGAPAVLVYGAPVLGTVLVVSGLLLQFRREKREHGLAISAHVIAVETRGLRDVGGRPLTDVLPPNLETRAEHLLVDFRQGIQDGEIQSPEVALEKLRSLPDDLARRERGGDRRDLQVVYGGLSPVPLTFLAGVLLDDESQIRTFDWDRHSGQWRPLSDADDGKRFTVVGLQNIPNNTADVVLAVSVSYGVRTEDLVAKMGDTPVVRLDLDGISTDCHWSEEKQVELGRQFFDTVKGIGRLGVRQIHLFLAAQNSVVFRFGRLYDKRNLPAVIVYQYEKALAPPYPWGVQMPVCGNESASVIRSSSH